MDKAELIISRVADPVKKEKYRQKLLRKIAKEVDKKVQQYKLSGELDQPI
jgi:hypothetical protein